MFNICGSSYIIINFLGFFSNVVNERIFCDFLDFIGLCMDKNFIWGIFLECCFIKMYFMNIVLEWGV